MDQMIERVGGVMIGRISGVTSEGTPMVEVGGEAPRAAEGVIWGAEPPEWSSCIGKRVLLARDDVDPGSMYVLGLLDPPAPAPEPAIESAVIPEELRVESGRELVIQCGKARIALRADGRIEIRGGHLVSRSSGPNKIKGASVLIN